jgi:MFS transporter, DHA1 family, inner membrane transport protein
VFLEKIRLQHPQQRDIETVEPDHRLIGIVRGSPLLAAATARLRRERVVVLALSGFALADAICALAPNYGVLLAARILAGASGALFSPTAYGMAAALAPPERRGAALATVALGMTIATVFGAPLGTWIGHAFGWRASFLLGALFSAVAATTLAMAPGAPPRLPPCRVSLSASRRWRGLRCC